MKASHREAYTDAMAEHARRLTAGTSFPLIVQVYRFFAVACDKADILHGRTPGDAKWIATTFRDDVQKRLMPDDILLVQTTKEVLSLVGHARTADITDELTPAVYRQAATPRGSNPLIAFAIFGPHSIKSHPILEGFKTLKKRIETSAANYTKKTQPFGQKALELDVALIGPPVE